MAIRGWSCALALLTTLGCGGEEFQSDGGSGGSSSGGSSSGGSSSGGSSSGGSSGSGATGGTGTGGEAGSVNPGGGGTGGQGGDGGTGGSVIPGCGPKPSAPLLLHTTLDDVGAIQTPSTGTGPGTHHGSIVPGICAGGFEIVTDGDHVGYPGTGNINLAAGTADFYFKPNGPPNGTDRHLMGVPGKFLILWDGFGNFAVGTGSDILLFIPAASVPFAANVWTRVTVIWELGNTGDTAWVYFDGAGAGGQPNPGPFNVLPIGDDSVFIGANGESDPKVGGGVFDDVKIYDGTEEP